MTMHTHDLTGGTASAPAHSPHSHQPDPARADLRGHAVALTGASGFVGRHAARALLSRGAAVRALTRDPSAAALALPLDEFPDRLTLVRGDAFDRRALAELTDGATAVIHLIGIIRQAAGQSFQRAHTDATRAVLDAALRSGVGRFVHVSALGARPDGRAPYQRTKAQAEQAVRASGLDWTIFRPSLIHGPGGEFVGMVHDWCTGQAPPYFFVPYFTRVIDHDDGVPLGRVSFQAAELAPVFVGDVARALADALTLADTVHEVFPLVGAAAMPWPEMLRAFQSRLPDADPALPVLGLPGPPHALMARAAKALGLSFLFPFDEGQAHMAQEDSTADITKFRLHFGWSPAAFQDTCGYLAQYAQPH
ncbi:MAG: hypothetical protein C0468_05800 [Planctomyces sp.]|nr:hypothetical protein [Planctomyces sp.]